MNNKKKMIGVVGGLGPYAGLDLYKKILDQTKVNSNREHLPVALLSVLRSDDDKLFLSGQNNISIADAIFNVLLKLEQIGARVAGIACNAAHSPRIFDVVLEKMEETNINIKVVHIINEVAKFIHEIHPKIRNVGVLCTTDTYRSKIYEIILGEKGLSVILPDEVMQENVVNKAIYDPIYGVKAKSNPVTEVAKSELSTAISYLQQEGAEAVVLGCTEMPLAISNEKIGETVIIDPTLILARALIREVNPNMLRPLDP